jgi:23S rRNA (uracil1939-C5)-methyltransferase
VPIRTCPLNLPGLDAVLDKAIGLLTHDPRFKAVARSLRALVGRQSLGSGEVLMRLILKERTRLRPFAEVLSAASDGLVGVLANMAGRRRKVRDEVVWGQGFLTEHVGEWRYRVSGAAFFQVNPYATPALVETVREATALTGRESVIDAYGGVGLFSVALAERAGRIMLIETDASAVADARKIIGQLRLGNTIVHEGSVEQAAEFAPGADVIICDPPREGMGTEALAALETQNARRFVYVACDPTSLARDSVSLRRAGYDLRWAQPIDLFPHTFHVETVAFFER